MYVFGMIEQLLPTPQGAELIFPAERWLLKLWSEPAEKFVVNEAEDSIIKKCTGRHFDLEVIHTLQFSEVQGGLIYVPGRKFTIHRRYGVRRGASFGDAFPTFLDLAQAHIRREMPEKYAQEADRICRLIEIHRPCMLALPSTWFSWISDDVNGNLYSHGSDLLGKWEGPAA